MRTDHPPAPQNASDASSPNVDNASVKAGHEITDINVLGLSLFGFGLIAALAGTFVAIVLMFRIFGAADTHLDRTLPQRETGAASRVHTRPGYAGPELQVTPEKDLMAMTNGNVLALQEYAWIDKTKGVVRLPIDRAMALVAQRGIPPISPGLTIEGIQQQRALPQVYGQVLRP